MTRTRFKYRPKGLTVVELLVATALASMMIAVTLGLLRTMALQQSALKARTHFAPWHRPLAEQLRRDVANSRSVELKGSSEARPMKSATSIGSGQEFDSLILTGYCSHSPSTFRPTHRPVRVVYRVETVDENTWLVRYEEELVSPSKANVRKELVCSGVTGIVVEILGGSEQEEFRSGSLPGSCRIGLLGQSDSSPRIEINFCR